MHAPQAVRDAAKQLRNDAAFRTIVEWLQASLSEQRRANDYQINEAQLRIGQGRAQCLTEVIEAVTPK